MFLLVSHQMLIEPLSSKKAELNLPLFEIRQDAQVLTYILAFCQASLLSCKGLNTFKIHLRNFLTTFLTVD